MTDVPPKDRDIAMVFQNYALYPHMTVAENMGFALMIAKTPKDEIGARVEEAAKILDLERVPRPQAEGAVGRSAPAGRDGPRHRPAAAGVPAWTSRCRTSTPSCACQTRTQIASLQARLGITTVYVTHDQVEAMTMGDRVAVMKDGLLQQVDTPLNLYEQPANAFVAGFIGSPAMNMGTFPVAEGGVRVGDNVIPLSRETLSSVPSGGKVIVGFRPESVELTKEAAPGAFPMIVRLVEELGSDAFVYGALAQADGASQVTLNSEQVIARVEPRDPPKKGQTVWLRIRPGSEHVFSAETDQRLSA